MKKSELRNIIDTCISEVITEGNVGAAGNKYFKAFVDELGNDIKSKFEELRKSGYYTVPISVLKEENLSYLKSYHLSIFNSETLKLMTMTMKMNPYPTVLLTNLKNGLTEVICQGFPFQVE